ncbi:MAG TPA: hypothetical protein VEP90_06750, partial [Methylomirabilota bacterium]|nr:hypothetical protein [Methylomirabilota bacterium]
YRFIAALYASTYPPFSNYLYKEGKKEIKTWERNFARHAVKAQVAPSEHDVHAFIVDNMVSGKEEENISRSDGNKQQVGSGTEITKISSFLDDQHFGKAAKYVLAWRCSVQNLLEESGFYSLAHILETETEIESSLLLASQFYYKQAVQVLRSFLEELVMPIHFCENEEEFSKWKANNYRTPPLRGRDGVIRRLTAKGTLLTSIATDTANLYSDLNSYVHGSENRLNYKNVHTPSSSALTFKYQDLCTWAEYLSRSVDLGIRLLRINYLQWDAIVSLKWEALRSAGRVMCTSCHNETDFDSISMTSENFTFEIPQPDGTWVKANESFPGFIKYTCRQCGSIITVTAAK